MFRVKGSGFRVQGVDDVWLQWHLATHAFGCGISVKSSMYAMDPAVEPLCTLCNPCAPFWYVE